MRALLALLVVAGVCGAERHAFYRAMREGAVSAGAGAGGTRRVFGGRAAALREWGAVCALLDRYWRARCSGTVLAPRWALTAAHCVSPRLAYVQYNTRRPAGADKEGDAAPVHYLYRHPGYRVVEENLGRGMDVTLLHHDVGLVRTRADMQLVAPPPLAPLDAMLLYDAHELAEEPVDVLGYGQTEEASKGEQLFVTRLVLASCERGAWLHCVCGAAARGAARGVQQRGVCAGDSGGPVVYRGAQVAVTSMGPTECVGDAGSAARGAPLTSVFTALRQYAPLLNATVHETDSALHMTRVSGAPAARLPCGAALGWLAARALL